MSTADPLAALHVAVNRVLPGQSADPFLPGEALGVQQAFSAYTAGSAYVNHLETGVLIPGTQADLAVLDRDPFVGDPAAIGETRVVATYVGGQPVYRA